jgi:hypothetical protein
MKRNTAPRMLATITPISWPLDNPLDAALVGVADVDDVEDGDVDDAEDVVVNEDDKDIEDDVDEGVAVEEVVSEGVAVEEVVDEVRVRIVDVEVDVVEVVIDEGGIAEVVVTGIDSDDVGIGTVGTGVAAGDVRPPYVQSEFNGICGGKHRYEKRSERMKSKGACPQKAIHPASRSSKIIRILTLGP